jgi:hypothetical protein
LKIEFVRNHFEKAQNSHFAGCEDQWKVKNSYGDENSGFFSSKVLSEEFMNLTYIKPCGNPGQEKCKPEIQEISDPAKYLLEMEHPPGLTPEDTERLFPAESSMARREEYLRKLEGSKAAKAISEVIPEYSKVYPRHSLVEQLNRDSKESMLNLPSMSHHVPTTFSQYERPTHGGYPGFVQTEKFQAFLTNGEVVYTTKAPREFAALGAMHLVHRKTQPDLIFSGVVKDQYGHPMKATHEEAVRICKSVGGRLPTSEDVCTRWSTGFKILKTRVIAVN